MANKITTFFSFQEEGNGLKRIAREVQETDGAINKLKVGFSSATREFRNSNAAQAGAIAGMGALAYKAIGYASDLEESINAVTVSYGENADAVLAIGENSAESFGLAQSEFNAMAVQFSSFANQIAERDGRQVSEVVQEITGRVADFASVMNLDVNTAAQVFMSTMAGETEPIRRFGKDVSAAAVELYALENGLISSKSQLTESIKVQARYGLLMEQTADVAGDFANTSDGLANSQRILSAEAKDLAAEFGENLAPALATIITGLNGLFDAADKIRLLDAVNLSWVEPLGEDIGQFFNALAFGDGAHEMRQMVDEFNAAEAAASSFDMTMLDGAGTMGEVRARVQEHIEATDENADAMHAANLVALRWNKTRKETVDGLEDHSEAQDLVTEAIEHGMSAEGRAEAETRRHNDTVRRSTEEARDRAAALEEVRQAQDELTNAVASSLGGDIAYRDSVRGTQDALYALVEAQNDSETEASELEEATDRVAEAVLRQAEAAAELAADQAEANGATQTAGERAIVMRNELQAVADTLSPTSALRVQLQGYIDQLNSTPSAISTQITTYYQQVGSQNAPTVQPNQGGPNATGGSTMPGVSNKVLENGPELWTDGANTYMMANRPGRVVPLRGGGVPQSQPTEVNRTYNITVQALAVTPEIEYTLRDAIDKIRRDEEGEL